MKSQNPTENSNVKFSSDLLKGSITRNILSLALPIMVANIIANAYNIVDMIFVGRLGPSSLAAVSLGGVLMSFTWTLLVGLAVGTSSMVSRFYGSRNVEMVSRVTIQSIIIASFISLLLAAFGILGVKPVLEIMGAKNEVLEQGVTYSRIVFLGSGCLIFLFVINSIFRGSGDVKTPMITLGISSILNIILDPLLIFGLGPFPELGVKGAAIATVSGQAVGTILNLYILYKGFSRIHITNWSIKPDLALLKTQISIAIPGSLQNLFQSIGGFVLMHIVASYGTFAVAAYGIGLRLDIMVMLPGWALGASVATVLGQNLGAGQPERAEKAAWKGSFMYFGILAAVCFLLWFFAEQVISIFNTDPEVVAVGAQYIQIVVFGYIMHSVALIMTMSMNGAGYTFVPMIIIAVSILGIRIPGAYILPGVFDSGIKGLWYAIVVSLVFHALLSVVYFTRGKWKTRKVSPE